MSMLAVNSVDPFRGLRGGVSTGRLAAIDEMDVPV
jgi:hypothetical protein